ncbi:helix-turn-helix domain-containing protein [Actinomadura rupiterrae]|uniref:helix-turn-helix domain-containing protein n=1 Tax=Actinomadura rupiterrae TaxID=559627 RepID=UPI0020A23815|nr:helix-turn-helix transcriptional regulator [Actinomadura rupiterrae]MCP2340660.1 ribosome-binding protein aMBF1 (putative translation factor) [Actinomadura rupiterrae]
MSGDDSRTRRPRDFAVEGQWPQALLVDESGGEPYGAQVAQELARRLGEAMAEQGFSANRLSRESGVNRQTIANVLAGAVWPDLMTIANLQRALSVRWLPDGAQEGTVRQEAGGEEGHGHLAVRG